MQKHGITLRCRQLSTSARSFTLLQPKGCVPGPPATNCPSTETTLNKFVGRANLRPEPFLVLGRPQRLSAARVAPWPLWPLPVIEAQHKVLRGLAVVLDTRPRRPAADQLVKAGGPGFPLIPQSLVILPPCPKSVTTRPRMAQTKVRVGEMLRCVRHNNQASSPRTGETAADCFCGGLGAAIGKVGSRHRSGLPRCRNANPCF